MKILGQLANINLVKLWTRNLTVYCRNLYLTAATYKLFKDRLKFENYLTNIKNIKHRVASTKLRLSDHNLLIEEGRRMRPRIPTEDSRGYVPRAGKRNPLSDYM